MLVNQIDKIKKSADEEQKELLSFLKEELQSSVPRRALIYAVMSQIDQKKKLEHLVDEVLRFNT
jgi:hypothetical protein